MKTESACHVLQAPMLWIVAWRHAPHACRGSIRLLAAQDAGFAVSEGIQRLTGPKIAPLVQAAQKVQ